MRAAQNIHLILIVIGLAPSCGRQRLACGARALHMARENPVAGHLLLPKDSSVLIIYSIILLIKLPIYILPYKKPFFYRIVRLRKARFFFLTQYWQYRIADIFPITDILSVRIG